MITKGGIYENFMEILMNNNIYEINNMYQKYYKLNKDINNIISSYDKYLKFKKS